MMRDTSGSLADAGDGHYCLCTGVFMLRAVRCALVALTFAPAVASSQENLVVNGDFSHDPRLVGNWTLDRAGWWPPTAQSGALGGTVQATVSWWSDFSRGFCTTGSDCYFVPSPPAYLTTSVGTVVGTTYQLGFESTFMRRLGPGPLPGALSLFWDDALVARVFNDDRNGLQLYSVVATSTNSVLRFKFEALGECTNSLCGEPYSWWLIDDVSLTAVPEPGTWALMSTGLLALGGLAARRRRTA